MQKQFKSFKMSFNKQPNMFFGKIIYCTCDLHLKLNILNLLNIMFLSNGLKMSHFPCSLLHQNFNTLKFLHDLIFYQIHPMNMYFYKSGHVFVVQKIWFQLYDFMHSFLFLYQKKMQFKHLIYLIYKIQNDIYIVSKKKLNFLINLTRHHFIHSHVTIHYNHNNVK
jgi:hypothetical protein